MIPLMALGHNYRVSLFAGLFILVAILLLAAWAGFQLWQPLQRSNYYIVLPDVSGLRPGTPVMVSGYNIGVIREISRYRADQQNPLTIRPNPLHTNCLTRREVMLDEPLQTAGDGRLADNAQIRFLATLAIDREWNREINTQSTAVLENPSLLSGPVVGLRLTPEGESLCPGSIISMITETDPIQSILSTVQQYVKEDLAQILAGADTTIGNVQGLVQRLDRALQSSEATISAGDDNLSVIIKQSRQLIDALAGSAGQLQQLSETLTRDLIDQSKIPISRIGMLASSLTETTRSAPDILAKTGELIEQTRRTMQRLNELLAKSSPDIGAVTTELDYSLRLVSDSLPGLLANLERATQNLAALFADLRADPAATLRGRGNEAPQWRNDR